MQTRVLAPVLAIAGILIISFLGALTAGGAPAHTGPSTEVAAPRLGTASVTPGMDGSPPVALGVSSAALALSLLPATHIHPDISTYVIILPDGSLGGAPSPPITVSGDVYTLTADYSGAIVDERNGSVFNGGGFTVTTTLALDWGFQVNTSSNVSVTDLKIAGEADGFEVLNSTNITITGSVANAAADAGFVSDLSTQVSFVSDFSNGSDDGFVGVLSSYVTFNEDTANTDGTAFAFVYVTSAVANYDTGEHSTEVGVEAEYDSSLESIDSVFSFAAADGVVALGTSNIYLASITAESCGIGVENELDSDVAVLDSNFSSAGTVGGEFLLTDGLVADSDSFFDSGSLGLYIDDGGYDSLNAITANASRLTGVDLENITSTTLSDSYGSGEGWNGLVIKHSQGVTSTDDTFNTTTFDGNGTLLVDSSNVAIHGDTDVNSEFGIQDIGSQYLDVSFTNASDDSFGFGLESDESPTLSSNVADYDVAGIYFESDTDFYAADDNTSFDNIGILEEEGVDGDVWFSSAYDCSAAGYEVEDDINSYYYGDEIVNTPHALDVIEASGTLFEEFDIVNATAIGVLLDATSDVTFASSDVSGSAVGFELSTDEFTYITANDFTDDQSDFLIDASQLQGVLVYWNNFVDGGGWQFVGTSATPNAIAFDDGYPTGGNYWSNWTGPDTMSGPGQNIPGADGIVDTPLPISGTFEDQYPLTQPYDEGATFVAFNAVGLPSGTLWGIAFSGQNGGYNTTSSEVGLDTGAVAWATYSYSVYAPAGWVPTPSHGTVTTNGTALTVDIFFIQATYTTTFHASGLAPGVHWNVTVGGTSYGGTGPTITVALGNGTYNYTVHAVAGYVVSPANGSVTVAANQPTVSIAFTAVLYSVTFTEAGLSSGTTWNVTFGGVSVTSTGTSITFHVANGSYAYTVAAVSGYSLVPSTGTQLVSGPGAGVTVAFTANSSTAPGGVILFWILLVVVIVLAVIVALLLLRGRRKPETATGPAAWSPPAGAASAPPPTPGPAGGPPPGVVAPPSPPSWKET